MCMIKIILFLNWKTGLWRFGDNCPSQLPINTDPFSADLERNVAVRDSWLESDKEHVFYPSTDGCCECEVNNHFSAAFKR